MNFRIEKRIKLWKHTKKNIFYDILITFISFFVVDSVKAFKEQQKIYQENHNERKLCYKSEFLNDTKIEKKIISNQITFELHKKYRFYDKNEKLQNQ